MKVGEIRLNSELLDLVPLIREELSDIRYELHKSMVERVISDMDVGETISFDDIERKIQAKFCLSEFPNEMLFPIISGLEENGAIKSDGIGFKILEKNELKTVEELLNNCFEDFSKILKSKNKEFDQKIDWQFKNAFSSCVYRIMDFLSEEVAFANRISIESIKYEGDSLQLENILDEYPDIKKDQFLKDFFEYLRSGDKNITNLIFTLIRSAVAFDLLRRGRHLSQIANHIGEDGFLLLDTNVIVSLVCTTDRTNEISKSVIKLAQDKYKFNLYYGKETAVQYLSILKWADNEMNSKKLPSKIAGNNQIISDYLQRNDSAWSDYFTEKSFYQEFLENEYNIKMMELEEPFFDENEMNIANITEALYYGYSQDFKEGKRERSVDSLKHDVNLFKYLIFKKKVDMKGLSSPWILSFDNTIFKVNSTLARINKISIPEGGYSLHPRTLLNTLLVFANIDFDESKRQNVVRSIVDYMILPPNTLTDQQYIKLITYKIPGLTETDFDAILDFFKIQPLKSEFDKALKENNIDEASKITVDMLNPEAIDGFISIRKTSEENARLKEALSRVRTEKQLLEERVKPSSINININISGIDPNTKEIIAFFLTQINKSYPEFFKENGIEWPETSDISKGKIDKIISVLEKGGKAAEKLGPIIQLIPIVKSALG